MGIVADEDTLSQGLESFASAIAEVEQDIIFGEDIQYPVTINGVNVLNPAYHEVGFSIPSVGSCVGSCVAVRVAGDEHKGKTFLGLMLGEIAIETIICMNKSTGMLEVMHSTNPAMFVPELGRVVFGAESWWRKINKPEDLEQITDADISSIWYVQALKALQESSTPAEKG